MPLKVQIFVAIIASVLLPKNKFVTGFSTSRIPGTIHPTYPKQNSPCNVVDDKQNVINESRADSIMDISERTEGLIAHIKAITNYMSEHSKLLSILCEKKTTLPGSFDTLISERSPISDNKDTKSYAIYLKQLNGFASTIHNFNDQCTKDFDSDLSKQLEDFRRRIQSTACSLEIGLRGMGVYTRNPDSSSTVANITGSDCQSWSGRICQIYSFLNAFSDELNTENRIFDTEQEIKSQEVDLKRSVIIG